MDRTRRRSPVRPVRLVFLEPTRVSLARSGRCAPRWKSFVVTSMTFAASSAPDASPERQNGAVEQSKVPRVSESDRMAFARQVRGLAEAEVDSEGSAEWRAGRIEEADKHRAQDGTPPLKTEPELHRRARDLGLLRR